MASETSSVYSDPIHSVKETCSFVSRRLPKRLLSPELYRTRFRNHRRGVGSFMCVLCRVELHSSPGIMGREFFFPFFLLGTTSTPPLGAVFGAGGLFGYVAFCRKGQPERSA
ncbi:hypothetical protein BDV23DRAFT_158702 [Aspergillus alliaceus]|uniref:Uncharacterized protein n=1 Tax=Petromyces alliaceus TaxID=209559 RepID=A0A5N7C4G1_PETAA|nr:hypothetical protein BDV23DRAFT_158702 [Aspergillus alliaceus]